MSPKRRSAAGWPGVGEKAADLRPFDAMDFARGLVGL